MNIEGQIVIGDYVISEKEDGVWIYRIDGEGGGFNAEDLEKVIAQFYEDNF